jgi:hypothetical protein
LEAYFSVVVVAENPRYTTTTNSQSNGLFFLVAWFGLQAGCESCIKQFQGV